MQGPSCSYRHGPKAWCAAAGEARRSVSWTIHHPGEPLSCWRLLEAVPIGKQTNPSEESQGVSVLYLLVI